MKISTLEYIHDLLKKQYTITENALKITRKNYHEAEKDGTPKEVSGMKATYDAARERHSKATEALGDFENQEF